MRFMLDTNICIFLIRQNPPQVVRRFTRYSPGDIGMSSITLAELEYGVAKSSQPESNRRALSEFLLPLEIAPFDENTAAVYGAVRTVLERRGTPVGSLDVLIGAHALCLGVTLVTNNVREFERIPKLRVVDWSR